MRILALVGFGLVQIAANYGDLQPAAAFEDCRGNAPRMIDLRVNLKWCFDPANGAFNHAREKIIWGRFWHNGGPIRDGYGDCQRDRQPYQNYDFCDAQSFLQGALEEIPEGDAEKYRDIIAQDWGPKVDPPGTGHNCRFGGNAGHPPFACYNSAPLKLGSQCRCPGSDQIGAIEP